ncbi:hybrid sensor histidine kinase/response regulator transcription factor [Pseudobacter ginsenosidimutans]|uniref:hybrid sensor histidine kinase/response regulator transcription factor n=1 Tax=Pseudobacter ginsenosidimutans TaxID=661488 RepID=UPI00102D7B5D|nr:hybrid sensor histidine kinase/response regulator transcription factor [Pseudobacter ginsenosidimutans]QEC44591.1 response regulator [Pseudobacter ginsenosidimutans]
MKTTVVYSFPAGRAGLFLISCLFTISLSVSGQQRLFSNQQHFGVEDGLSQSYITGIIQDADGFIWLSTMDGLNRYDGRKFRTFRYNPKDSSSLAANTLGGLGKLVDNIVTIYYDAGKDDEFDLRSFRASRNNIRKQLAAIPGIRWQSYRFGYTTNNWFFTVNGHKGIGWMNRITGEIQYANTANGQLQNDTICAIAESPEGRIYVVNRSGVHVSDTGRKSFRWVGFKTGLAPLSETVDPFKIFGEKFSIVPFQDNKLAILEKNVLTILDIDKKSSVIIPLPAPKSNAIEGNNGLQVDPAGRIYFEYFGCIYRLTESGVLELLWEHTGLPSRISSFYIDRSDVLWVSLNAQGLLKIDLQALHFQSYKNSGNFIEMATELLGSSKELLPPDWRIPDAAYYFRQAWDDKGQLYSCNNWYDRSAVFQFTKQGFRRFTHLPAQRIFTGIVTMPGNEIWAFDQVEAVWYAWSNPDAVPRKLQPDPGNFTDVQMTDAKYIGGFIWMATNTHGLFQFDGKKLIRKYTGPLGDHIVPNVLTEICADPSDKNKFWVGSRGGGLMLWDAQKGMQRIYTEEDGLPNNTIYCILPDRSGKIWCSTNKGIFRLDPRTSHITVFEKTDGLQGNEFNRAHKLKLPDGQLLFGGLDGYTIFHPDDFETSGKTSPVPVLLTGLQINNEKQDINLPGSIVKESLSTLSVISLPYDRNYLSFEFAALMYNQPQKIKYRYRLLGADKGWIETGYSNLANYSALLPGNYTLLLNATDPNGEWSPAITSIKVNIEPPFWRTWWAWALYILAVLALIRWYLVFRERRLQIQQNLLFEKREALRLREIDELKDRFFSNITHEFRTPLTLIHTPLESLEHDPALPPATVKNITTARKNSTQLLRLVNEFLDFAKLNNGQLKLKAAAGEINVFTASCVSAFDANAREKNIALSFTSTVSGFYLFDEEKWEKIVSNLLSNALKFAPVNGIVAVTLSSATDNQLKLEVCDNGPGIPAALQQKIFTRFYQVDDSDLRNYGGTGIGLSLVKELTTLMKGSITVESEPGKQTRFTVTVPLEKTAAAPTSTITEEPLTIKKSVQASPEDLPLLLVVEDNDELRAFLVETLSGRYRVLEASDGLKAWEIILQELPDMVICDVMMPGQNGFDLCRICKEDSRTSHIGFILLTSKSAHDARLKGLGAGADDYITKPFSLRELELRTANLYQLQQKQRERWQMQLANLAPEEPLPTITDPFLEKLYQEIEAKLDDPELDVDHLCKVMAASRSTLNRKIKALLNITAVDLIRQYRLQRASGMIAGGLDIATAAYRTGFSSPSYFSQCFKEQFGLSPSDWVSKQK